MVSSSRRVKLELKSSTNNNNADSNIIEKEGRREFVSSCLASGALLWSVHAKEAVAEEESITESTAETIPESTPIPESIAERAARLSREMGENALKNNNANIAPPADSERIITEKSTDTRTIYDFSVPIAGVETPITSFVGPDAKAVLVINIKQDDPYARKNIPALIALATKYGPKGLVIIAVPTDQGYYEPDTSVLIRLKLNSEYGYGINPAAVLTDKMNILGTAAHPFMRWLQANCRTPQGLGKIQGNFEKFLIDASTGLPLRRYPRKYLPYDMNEDIEALVLRDKHTLPPASVAYREEWRGSIKEADTDTYRFQKGLNVFDQ